MFLLSERLVSGKNADGFNYYIYTEKGKKK